MSAPLTIVRAVLVPMRLYLRHVPIERGRWRVESRAVRLAARLRGRLRRRLVTTRHGFRLFVDGESQVGRIVYATAGYEDELATLLRCILKPGDTFVDGGAHIGFFSILASTLVGPAGRVVSFEPSRRTREALERNVAVNRCANVTVRPVALGHTGGRSSLAQDSANNTGHATLRPMDDAHSSEDVDVVALDDERDALGRVAAIKLDLEGFELNALEGMQQLLRTWQPHVVVEVTDSFLRAAGRSALELFRFLTALGYEAYVPGAGGSTRVVSEDDWQRLAREQFNAFFTVTR